MANKCWFLIKLLINFPKLAYTP